jgi:hypothetical protein
MIKVESDRPLPGKFPFEQMNVGDSFVIPDDITRSAVTMAAWRYGKKTGTKFSVKRLPGELRYACWRIA